MNFESFLSGRAQLEAEEVIRSSIKRSQNFNPKAEDSGQSKTLLFFRTSKQQSWLVATSERLYCILDDVRKSEPHVNWSIPSSELVEGGMYRLRTRRESADVVLNRHTD